jgi:hypothetical protein
VSKICQREQMRAGKPKAAVFALDASGVIEVMDEKTFLLRIVVAEPGPTIVSVMVLPFRSLPTITKLTPASVALDVSVISRAGLMEAAAPVSV